MFGVQLFFIFVLGSFLLRLLLRLHVDPTIPWLWARLALLYLALPRLVLACSERRPAKSFPLLGAYPPPFYPACTMRQTIFEKFCPVFQVVPIIVLYFTILPDMSVGHRSARNLISVRGLIIIVCFVSARAHRLETTGARLLERGYCD